MFGTESYNHRNAQGRGRTELRMPTQLLRTENPQEHVTRKSNNRTSSVPDFSDQIVYSVPSQPAVSHTSPPSHEVRRKNVRMCVEMVSDRYLTVAERWRNKSYSERVVVERNRICGRYVAIKEAGGGRGDWGIRGVTVLGRLNQGG